MTSLRVAAVQASYVLMDRAATLDRVASLTAEAATQGAQLVAFPRSSSGHADLDRHAADLGW